MTQSINVIHPSMIKNSNSERGRLPLEHDGADVTRLITAEQVAKFLECQDCQMKPVVYLQVKLSKKGADCIGVCGRHWIKFSDTVVGWSGE